MTEACKYAQLRVDALDGGNVCLGEACSCTARASSLSFDYVDCNTVVASASVAAGIFLCDAMTVNTASTVSLTAGSMALNGVSATPNAVIVPSATLSYTVPVGFANIGAVIGAPSPILSVYLPSVTAVPQGYSLMVYNLGVGTITVNVSTADMGIDFLVFQGTQVGSVTIAAGTFARFAWTGDLFWFSW